MRVALLNRGLHSHFGGDLVQVEETAAALKLIGVWARVEPNDPEQQAPHLTSVDLAHIFHTNFGFTKANWKWVRAARLPYVVTPIYYDANKLGMSYEEQKEFLEGAAAVMPFSETEADMIMKCTGFPGLFKIVPNGTRLEFFDTSDPMKREGVLAVAAREGSKGTGIVKELCEELGLKFTLAQGFKKSEMPGLYRSHRVFVHAADLEVMSLVIGEGLCANCRCLATDTNPGNSWYRGLKTFTPHMPMNRENLRVLLEHAYHGEEWDYTPNEAARKLTWDFVAKELKRIYEEVVR